MTINSFTAQYVFKFIEVPNTPNDFIFRINLIDRASNHLYSEYTQQFSYSKRKFIEDIANPQKIGPFASEDELKEGVRRHLANLVFFSLGITDFYPLDIKNDIDFLFE